MAISNQDGRIDQPTGTTFVGHEWDGIEELNTPLPRWWLWTFYATIVFSLGYVIAYPAWPLLEKGTEGLLGWTSRGQLAGEMETEAGRKSAFLASLEQVPVERIAEDEAMMRAAVAGGRAAFKVNCVQCHGSGAAGSEGFPNLNDDDWLWGGDLKAIEFTLIHGVRQPGVADTRMNLMPAFGARALQRRGCRNLRRKLRGLPWSGWRREPRIRRAQPGRCDLALWPQQGAGGQAGDQWPQRRDARLGRTARSGHDQDAGRLRPFAGRWRDLRGAG
jgi:cbb3-type cytochrome c oxidase subunit III